MSHLAALWSETTASILGTYKELDHNARRVDGWYCGTWPAKSGGLEGVVWPEAKGTRVFVYLKQMPLLPRILSELTLLEANVVAVLDHADAKSCREVSGPNVVIYDKPIDISKLAKGCELVLSNGGHGLVSEFLREGVPQFILPLHCEQAITGGRIADMNAGQIVSPGNPALALQELRRSVENPGAFVGAASFQQRYAHWSNEYSVELAYARLLNSCPPKI